MKVVYKDGRIRIYVYLDLSGGLNENESLEIAEAARQKLIVISNTLITQHKEVQNGIL